MHSLECNLCEIKLIFVFRGSNGGSATAGGAAGGSIWIATNSLQGDGVISVSGGSGGLNAGGGSGGMLALYYKESSLLFDLQISGGTGKSPGASGTIYLQKGNSNGKLVLDNNKQNSAGFTTLVCQPKALDYYFGEIEIRRSGKLTMISCAELQSMTLQISGKLIGDGSGALQVGNEQNLYLPTSSFETLKMQTSVDVQKNGVVLLPENILLSDGANLQVAGSLTGVKTITVAKNGKFKILHPGSTFYKAMPGVFQLDTLYVKKGGVVESMNSNKIRLNIDLLKLNYGAIYSIPANVGQNYNEKIVQKRGPALTASHCPHGVVLYTSTNKKDNRCGEGKWSSISAPIPYQVVMNISGNDGIYRLVNVTKYHENYNMTCNYIDFRLLPGQSCSFKPGSYGYRRLEIYSGATMSFEADGDRIIKNALDVEYLRIYADGKLRALSVPSSGGLSFGVGGSYGGVGGKGDPSDVYGDVVLPESYGTKGGGGQLTVRVTREFLHDGVIDASAISTNTGGGGSGGSLLIFAEKLKGTGEFKANGGESTSSNSGGGGGGRIGIHLNSSLEDFQGQYKAYGGSGVYRGSSGTIYIQDKNKIKGILIIKGEGSGPAFPPNTTIVEFDSLFVGESTIFQLSVPRFVVTLLQTDGTGKIIIPTGCTMTVVKLPLGGKIECELDVSGSLHIQVPVIITSSINLRGVIKTSQLTVAKMVNLKWIGSELQTKSLVLRQQSSATITGLSKVNIDVIHVGPYARIEVSESDFTLICERLIFESYSTLVSNSALKSFNITSRTLTIHNFASIGVSGGGYKQGTGYDGRPGIGASHGGEGAGAGKDSVYGSVFEPNEFGSGSIDSNGASNRGGGKVVINVAEVLHVDGEVHADGEGSQNNGGGSGGSIMIKAKALKGFGVFRANGQSGGSGGRIAVYVEDKQSYSGVVSSFGGCRSSLCGAAGTVFFREYLVGIPYETTIVNNAGRSSSGITSIMHRTQTKYTLQKLRIIKEGRVEVVNPDSSTTVNIDVLDIDGDFTGQIRVQKNQKLSLGSSGGTAGHPFVLRCAVRVEVGAELILAPRVFVKETTLKPTFDIFGKVQGGQELIIGRNALVSISPEGIIGTKSSQKGILTMRELNVLSGGHIIVNYAGKSSVEVRAVSINIGYNGILESPFVLLKTPALNVHMGGQIVSDSFGYRSGPGVGGHSGGLLWDGGSHGGCGGGYAGAFCPIYGSMFGSLKPGSGGGAATGSNGGPGGGVIVLEVATLHLDGIITADGGDGQGNAGGGSGGTIHVTIGNVFRGRGTVGARGGKPGIQGGGGGGGRIYVNGEGIDIFKGHFDARGGLGTKSTSGSPGTIFLLQTKNGLSTKTLILDNKDISLTQQLPVVFNETISSYYLDVLHLVGSLMLVPDHDMIIEKLVTSPLSTISIPNGLVVEIDRNSYATSPACSFHVAEHGELRLPSSVTFLGPDNQFSGTITGVLDMIIGEGRRTVLSSSARTALYVDGNYTFISNRGEYKFASLLLKSNAVVSFEKSDMTEVPLVFATLELRYGSVLQGSWLNIQAVSILVHSGAKMDLAERGHPGGRGDGRGVFYKNYAPGAGHAGVGGGDGSSGGEWYGDMVAPNSFGSGGGYFTSQGGKGGGLLNILASEELVIDGSILVSGGDCTKTGCGGGSGGSIYIICRSLKGVGIIDARGGNGNTDGGGGSGGRVAIHLNTKLLFQGDFKVLGGTGRYNGASGTVYIEDNKDLIPRRNVIVDNQGRTSVTKPTTVLTNNVGNDVILDELKIQGPSSVSFFNKSKISGIEMEISVIKLTADTSGEIVIQANQVMFSETSESEETSYTLRTNLVIHEAGLFVTASKLFVDGAELTVSGRLMNVRHFILETGSRVTFSKKSQTGVYLKPFGSVFLSSRGSQLFGSLTLKSGSTFSAPENLRIHAGDIIVKNGVVIRVKDLEITAATLNLERGTIVSANGVSNGGHGAGSSSHNVGSGGSYASPGGNNKADKTYGSLFKPKDPGSEGGAGSDAKTGGKGGGVIIIKSTLLQLDGKMTVNGGDGNPGSNAGGGSGGSIYLEVDYLAGKGEIIADGGRGDGSGSCGSGGRIGIFLKSRYTYRGSIRSASLNCGPGELNGGPGTMFISEVKNKHTYTRLVLDNRFSNWDKFVTLKENQVKYDFDEIVLRGGACLQLSKEPNVHHTLTVGLLSGDRSGFVYVHRNQSVIISENTPARVPASFKVDEGGLVVVPHRTIIVGQRRYSIESRGTILGMRNMELASGRVVKFYESSILGIGKDRRDFTGSERVLEFGSLILHSSSILVIDDVDQIKIFANDIDLKYNATIVSSSLNFTVSSLHVEIGGQIDCSGNNNVIGSKAVQSNLATGTGAGHGSVGGKGTSQGGPYHGSLYNPTERGKPGGMGPNGQKGGQGGGSIILRVGSSLIVDGKITVSGGNAGPHSNAGGGSGGTIHVTTNSYRGFGEMDIRGGTSGGSSSGSGAGGRIAIYSERESLYRGVYQASGGTEGSYGGPGTIFLRYLRKKRFYTQLRFGERHGNYLLFVTLDERNITDFKFDEMIVERKTAVQLKQDGQRRSLKVNKLTGDGTGYIHVGSNHTFYLRGSTGHGEVSKPPVNLYVELQGTAVLDTSFFVVSDNAASPNGNAFTINGQVVGVQHLYLTRGRKMMFKSQAQTVGYNNGSLVPSLPGTFALATLEIHDGAQLSFTTSHGMRGLVAKMDVKFGAKVFADQFDFSKYVFEFFKGFGRQCSFSYYKSIELLNLFI